MVYIQLLFSILLEWFEQDVGPHFVARPPDLTRGDTLPLQFGFRNVAGLNATCPKMVQRGTRGLLWHVQVC